MRVSFLFSAVCGIVAGALITAMFLGVKDDYSHPPPAPRPEIRIKGSQYDSRSGPDDNVDEVVTMLRSSTIAVNDGPIFVSVATIDSCEYVVLQRSSNVAVIHKFNCKNHPVRP